VTQNIPVPSGLSIAPPLVSNIHGRSLASYCPDVKPVLLLAITKHELDLGQLFKVNPQLKDQPKDAHLQLSDVGIIIKAERDMSHQEDLSFHTLHDPPPHIFQHHLASPHCSWEPIITPGICPWLIQVHVRPIQIIPQV